MGRTTLRRVAFAIGGALFGVALDFAASAAAGYEQDSAGLDVVLGFLGGFPLSLLAFATTVYFLGLAPPLLWMSIGWTVSRPAAERAVPPLLAIQAAGVVLAPLAFTGRIDLVHWSEKTWGGLLLFAVLWLIGFTEAFRLLHRPLVPVLPLRARRGRLVVALVLLVAAPVVVLARPRIVIACGAAEGSCTVAGGGWGRRDTATWTIDQLRVRRGVPYSTLDVGLAADARTILRAHCADVILGGNFFNRCEARKGRLLADLELFLQRREPARFTATVDAWEGALLLAAALACAAIWVGLLARP